MVRREVLFFASYCGDDNPQCTAAQPCADCLAMSNVYLVDVEDAEYVGQLAPTRPAANAWMETLRALLRPLAGTRPLSSSRFDKLAKLAGASWLVGRRR